MSLSSVVGNSGEASCAPTGAPRPSSVFQFDAKSFRDAFQRQGYVHIRNGVTPEFIHMARERLEVYQRERLQFLAEREIKNKKQQYLLEFPDSDMLLRGACEAVATVTGLSREAITLSERHINVYVPNAAANAPAHKDRFASTISVGLPLHMPKNSNLLIYPDQSREVNKFDSVVDWRNSCTEEELPENVLKGAVPTRLFVDVGDVILFSGSTIYHGRENSANAVILYFKLNDMRLDPLGEDPFVAQQRQASIALLTQSSDRALLNSTIEVSPRLVRVNRHYMRNHWEEIIFADIAGENSFVISEEDFVLVRSISGRCAVHELFDRMGVPASKVPEYLSRIRRLGMKGGIDFLS